MQIGLKIKEIRERKNISQVALTKRIKILNQSQMCKIENGKRGIRVNEVVEIAKALNVPVSEIII
jgi:transcriptional regulator with XRE-family HTH domain